MRHGFAVAENCICSEGELSSQAEVAVVLDSFD